MNNLLERVIKRNNKKRGINITVATMVMFLLSCTGVVAKDISNDFTNSEQLTEQVTIVDGNKINVENTGRIDSKEISGQENTGNGIGAHFVDKGLDLGAIKNTGRISAESSSLNKDYNNTGNGIGLYSNSYIKARLIDNSGDIIGRGENINSINYNSIGNGIGIWTNGNSTIEVTGLKNTGTITGEGKEVKGNDNNVGNGVGFYSKGEVSVPSIENTGNIAGKVGNVSGVTTNQYSRVNAGNGIGIFGYKEVRIGDINNSGVISGKAEATTGLGINAGNGIGIYSYANGSDVGNINNTGVIMGSNNAISVTTEGFKNSTGNISNFGILLGKTPIDVSNNQDIVINNQGLMVTINRNGEIDKIESGNQSSENIKYKDIDYKVINGKVLSTATETIKASELNKTKIEYSNLILNGIDKTLTIDTGLTLNNSIINAYKTAVEVTGENIFTGNNITINGGGLDGQTAVVVGDDLGNTVKLSGDSIINGNINLGGGKDLLVFGNMDTASYSRIATYSANSSTINITGNIDGVETIDVNQKVVFGENAKVTGVNNIEIGNNGSLGLTLKTDGNTSTHALSGNNVTVTGNDSSAGDIILITNGIGNGTTVDMTGVKLENVSVGLNSILYKAETVGDGSSIKIGVNGSLDDMINSGDGAGGSGTDDSNDEGNSDSNSNDSNNSNNSNSSGIMELAKGIKYQDLNKIVTSIEGEDLNELSKLIGESSTLQKSNAPKEYLVKYLAEVYAASPYSLSSELSRKSADMFENVVRGKDLKPELNRWSVYGGFTHIDGGLQDSYYGIDDQVYTTNAYGVDTDIKLTGIYVMGEYGLQEDLVTGLIFGGNKGEAKINNGSKVEGDNLYIGAFAKKYVNNLRLLVGLGYQYGDFQADRYSLGADMIRHYDSDYNDNTFNIYADAKYTHKLTDGVYLEPSIGLSHIYVSQDGAKESGNLGMATSSKDFNYTTLKAGVDIRKEITTSKAKHSVTTGVFYDKMLDGANEEKLEAKFNNSTKSMNLLVAEKNEHKVGVRVKYEVELQNGVTFDVKGSYSFARDTHKGDMKHKDNNEWVVGAGIGYRF